MGYQRAKARYTVSLQDARGNGEACEAALASKSAYHIE